MQIYWFKAQASHRVLALAKHLKIDAELIHMDLMGGDLQKESYAKINPNKKVPTLIDGDVFLWEASAIMAYLSIKAGSDMWPAHNPAEQVEVLRWLSWNDYHFTPACSPFYFEHIVKTSFGFGTPEEAPLKEGLADLNRFAKVLDDHLQGKQFVACQRLTIADFQLASTAAHWKASEMPFENFPNIVKWLDNLVNIPAWKNPWPADQ